MNSDSDSPPTKRELILRSASELFLDLGFEGTSMDQIALAASVSKQTVYSHFGSKEALFTAVVAAKCEQHQLTDDLFGPERELTDVLTDLARRFSELILSDEAIALHRVCIAGGEKYSQIAALFWQAGPVWMQGQLADYIEKKQQLGEIRDCDALHAAQQFLYMLKGEAHLRKLLNLEREDAAEEQKSYQRSCVSMFVAAYAR